VQQDRAAAQAQAAQRRLVIERVNKMLFNETDKAKGFHGAVLHSDVLAERAAQIELKAQAQALRAAHEQVFVRQQGEQLELAEEAELQKLAEARTRALAQRDAQLAQLEELKAGIRAEREARRIEVRARACLLRFDVKEQLRLCTGFATRGTQIPFVSTRPDPT
jgi:excinuclease UvrABC nuclease subunit